MVSAKDLQQYWVYTNLFKRFQEYRKTGWKKASEYTSHPLSRGSSESMVYMKSMYACEQKICAKNETLTIDLKL